MLTEEELMILKIVRRLGPSGAIDRLLNVVTRASRGGTAGSGGWRGGAESSRFEVGRTTVAV